MDPTELAALIEKAADATIKRSKEEERVNVNRGRIAIGGGGGVIGLALAFMAYTAPSESDIAAAVSAGVEPIKEEVVQLRLMTAANATTKEELKALETKVDKMHADMHADLDRHAATTGHAEMMRREALLQAALERLKERLDKLEEKRPE